MGKIGKWFKSFLPSRKEKAGRQVSILLDESRSAPIPSPVPKEKKRWSFKRSAGGVEKELTTTDSTSSGLIRQESEAEVDQKQHAITLAAATDAAMAAAQAAAVVIRLSTTSKSSSSAIEKSAATKIQAVFRSYLARKALRALKGLVKLQALVRGYLVRKQATATLHRMQALVTVQARARAQRIHMVEDSCIIPQRQSTHRGSPSPQDPRHLRAYEMEKNMEEDVKIVEMDIGESKGSSRSRNNYSITNSEKIDPRFSSYYGGSRVSSKSDYCQQVSPAPSALTDMSPSACGSHSEEFSFNTVQSSPQCYSATCKPYSMRECFISQQEDTYSIFNDHPLCPSYMANTESSMAKVRSQSAPKQRPDTCERQPSRRRPSMEGRNIPRIRMQRSSSQVGSSHNGYHYPWSIKLDKSNMSLKGSDCGSTSTALTNTNYCRSIAAYEVHHDSAADIRAYYGMPSRSSN